MSEQGQIRKLDAHVWERQAEEWYVEPSWVSERLFEVEDFAGSVWDPCCGMGRIPTSADKAGHYVFASDVVDRGYGPAYIKDFLQCDTGSNSACNIVCNPPFDRFEDFAHLALACRGIRKVAMIWLVRRLNAARWLQKTPLARVYLLTPRPSMPPGHVILRGEKPGGGTQDFCWLVWDTAHRGPPELAWLHRDEGLSG
jgi:hypothetical protein